MAINSREKGKVGERELANLCKKYGFNKVRRGQQYSGIEGEDVVGLDGVHVEVKRVERLNLSKAMRQAIDDAKGEKVPVVAHRKNYENWLITMRVEDWFELYRAWREIQKMNGREE